MRVIALFGICLSCIAFPSFASGGGSPSKQESAAVGPNASNDDAMIALDRLLHRFRKMPGLYAEFREEKRISLLSKPLVNHGRIYFSEGMLLRETLKPKSSQLLIHNGHLFFSESGGVERMDMSKNPAMQEFVNSFLKVLEGDRGELDKSYRIQFSEASGENSTKGWKLELIPRNAPMNQLIASVELLGIGLVIENLKVNEKNGDESFTVFSKVDIRRKYKESERKEIFALAWQN